MMKPKIEFLHARAMEPMVVALGQKRRWPPLDAVLAHVADE
jgi:hypothetical protein